MNKALLQFFLIVITFVAMWFALTRINWVTVLQVDKVAKSTEEKLGEMCWKIYSESEVEVHSDTARLTLDSLVKHLCRHNNINNEKINLHILQNDAVNAFALPGHYLVVYTGLINSCNNEAELMGVLGHEIAHIQKNHVMKKLVNELGLSVLVSITSGNNGGQLIRKIAKQLSSTSYTRDLEREADQMAVDYMLNAKINPAPFADFLYRLSDAGDQPGQVWWISTHPESRERAESVVNLIRNKTIPTDSVLTADTWKAFKQKMKD